MVLNKKVTGTAKSIPVGICIGMFVALVVTLSGALITAWLVSNERISDDGIGYSAMIILMASSMLGTFTAQSLVKHQKLIICAATGGSYYLMLLSITALFFGGQYQGMGVTALVIAAGTAVIILTGIKGSAGHNRKLKKYGYG